MLSFAEAKAKARNLVRRKVVPESEVDDVAQELVIASWEAEAKGVTERPAECVAIDYLRRSGLLGRSAYRAGARVYREAFVNGESVSAMALAALMTALENTMLSVLGQEMLSRVYDLPAREMHAVLAHIHPDCTQRDLAAQVGVSESWISQLQRRAFESMRDAA